MDHIIELLDSEIERLSKVRAILLNGRIRIAVPKPYLIRRRRPMSPETKAKIGAAMAKRWAKRRKAA